MTMMASMWRVASLGVLLLATSACTIVVREGSSGAGAPPPPPPPPRAPQHQPAKGYVAPPPAPAHKPPAHKPPAHQPPAQQQTVGTLKVVVLHGACDVRVDGRSHGTTSALTVQLPTGSHVVTCQPAGGVLQAHTASVQAQAVTQVQFDVAATKGPRPVPKPPVGRPTPQ